MFAQLFVQAQIKENIKAPRHRTLVGGTTGGFPSQRARNAETVSIWWRHHGHGCWSSGNSRSIDSHNFDLVIPEYFGLITTVVNYLGLTVYIPTQSLNHITINSLAPGRSGFNFKSAISHIVLLIGIFRSSYDTPIIMPSDECHGTYLKISQQWFR